jgi:hypothetical protein
MLKRLLAEARQYHPSYGGGLANHLPMTLIALDRLGAAPARLEAYARAAVSKLEPAPKAGDAISEANWRERFGDPEAFADYLGFFRREVTRLNARAALRAYLPDLAPGVAAAAFHPLIRTAYGVIAEDREEITFGLAYWATRHLPLPAAAQAEIEAPGEVPLVPGNDPAAILRQLRGRRALDFPANDDNLIDREIAAAAALPAFPAIAAALAIDDLTLDRLRSAAALLFLGADDFNSLHAVTGLHAARILADFVADRRGFAAEVWRALLALYLSLDRPDLPTSAQAAELAARDLPDWNAILPAAAAAEDDHAIKLAFSALAESRAGGGRIYRYLAARKLGLLDQAIAADLPPIESRSGAPAAAAGR